VTFPVWVRLTVPGSPATFWASVALAALIVFAHRTNIRRLVQGTENRFRTRGASAPTARPPVRPSAP
jgi:glycerol-3-phosphate acyltransferase PlsY